MTGAGEIRRHPAIMLGERYRLVERLGAGGMSVVWRGYDEILGRRVAVKVLADRLAADPSFRHRIRLEAQAAARLCHPNITNVYDYGEAVRDRLAVPYVVMELVDGASMAARLGRDRQLPWREAVAACAEVAAALAAAHARGVVHRDVTPGNVMLTAAGAKVVDFGISALVGERDSGPGGQLLGTPAYLAPERLDGGQVGSAADVYALGLLLYRSLVGALPWRASTTTEMLRAHLYREPAPMPAVEGLPDGLTELCQSCLVKDPAGRPDSRELARALADAVGVLVALPPAPALGTDATRDPAADPDASTTILPSLVTTGELWLPNARPAPEPSIAEPIGGPRGRAAIGHPTGPADTRVGGYPGRPVRRTRGSRRFPAGRFVHRRAQVEVAAVGVGLLALTGLVWAATSQSSAGGPGVAQAATPQEAPAAACRVDYRLRSDSGRSFDADLTVTNTSREPLRDWTLAFAFPGDQKIGGEHASQWSQQGRTVVSRTGADELAPGRSAALRLTANYAGVNRLPVTFRLAGSVCDAQVSGVAGAPPTTPASTSGTGGGAPDARQVKAPPAPAGKEKKPRPPAGPDKSGPAKEGKPGPGAEKKPAPQHGGKGPR